jgi:hypothetical protein
MAETTEQQNQYDLERERASYQQVQQLESEQQEQENSKMGWGLFLIALVLGLIADVVELLTVGTLGWFVGFIIDLILAGMLGLSASGRKQWKKWVWGPIIETVPILSTIPLFRAAFLIWSFASSRSTTLQAISSATSLGSKK